MTHSRDSSKQIPSKQIVRNRQLRLNGEIMGMLYFLLVVLVLLLIVFMIVRVFGAEAQENKTIIITTATVMECNQNETQCQVIAVDEERREIELGNKAESGLWV